MFDEKLRPIKDLTFNPVTRIFHELPPWLLTLFGLFAGVAAAIAVWQQMYMLGLALWLLNRIFDGMDGAVARRFGKQSDFGGYLDIVVDFIVYAMVPIGLAAGVGMKSAGSTTAVTFSLIFLLTTYYVNAASWMYLAAILEKRTHSNNKRFTSITMPAGIIGGTETIIFYAIFILLPAYLVWLFSLMGLLIVVTIVQRLVWAANHL